MERSRNPQYTPGFIFDSDLNKVLLVHKQKPDWQKGKINGIGGKYEGSETPEECIARETHEESTLDIRKELWVYVGTMHQTVGDVGILAAKYTGSANDAVKNDHEDIEWFDVSYLPSNVISNLRWLVPLSLEKLEGKFRSFDVHN